MACLFRTLQRGQLLTGLFPHQLRQASYVKSFAIKELQATCWSSRWSAGDVMAPARILMSEAVQLASAAPRLPSLAGETPTYRSARPSPNTAAPFLGAFGVTARAVVARAACVFAAATR